MNVSTYVSRKIFHIVGHNNAVLDIADDHLAIAGGNFRFRSIIQNQFPIRMFCKKLDFLFFFSE